MSWDNHIDEMRAELLDLKDMLEPLENGSITIGERTGDGQNVDRTQAQITHLSGRSGRTNR